MKISHKRKALQWVIDKFVAYIAHLSTLCQDIIVDINFSFLFVR